MLTIKELTVKNFMSVGNQAQAIDFSNKSLVLVIGENMDLGGDDAGARNGTGKTTIINALLYMPKFYLKCIYNFNRKRFCLDNDLQFIKRNSCLVQSEEYIFV